MAEVVADERAGVADEAQAASLEADVAAGPSSVQDDDAGAVSQQPALSTGTAAGTGTVAAAAALHVAEHNVGAVSASVETPAKADVNASSGGSPGTEPSPQTTTQGVTSAPGAAAAAATAAAATEQEVETMLADWLSFSGWLVNNIERDLPDEAVGVPDRMEELDDVMIVSKLGREGMSLSNDIRKKRGRAPKSDPTAMQAFGKTMLRWLSHVPIFGEDIHPDADKEEEERILPGFPDDMQAKVDDYLSRIQENAETFAAIVERCYAEGFTPVLEKTVTELIDQDTTDVNVQKPELRAAAPLLALGPVHRDVFDHHVWVSAGWMVDRFARVLEHTQADATFHDRIEKVLDRFRFRCCDAVVAYIRYCHHQIRTRYHPHRDEAMSLRAQASRALFTYGVYGSCSDAAKLSARELLCAITVMKNNPDEDDPRPDPVGYSLHVWRVVDLLTVAVTSPELHPHPIQQVGSAHRGTRIISVDERRVANIWSLEHGRIEPVAKITMDWTITPNRRFSVCLAAGERAFVATSTGHIQHVDLAKGESIVSWPTGTYSIEAMLQLPGGKIAVATSNGEVSFYALLRAGADEVATVSVEGDCALSLALSQDRAHVIVGYASGFVRVWAIVATAQERPVCQWGGTGTAPRVAITGVAVDAGTGDVYTAATDGAVRCFPGDVVTQAIADGVTPQAVPVNVHTHAAAVRCMSVQPGNVLVSVDVSGTHCVWDLRAHRMLISHSGILPPSRKAIGGDMPWDNMLTAVPFPMSYLELKL